MYLMTLVKNINNTFKIKKECSNHLVSNQADFSLEALKSCFIYKYGRNKTKNIASNQKVKTLQGQEERKTQVLN